MLIDNLGFGFVAPHAFAHTGAHIMKHTWKTKCHDGVNTSHTVDFPETLDDELWTTRFFNTEMDVIKCLRGNWVIKFQARLRKHSSEDVEQFCVGAKHDRRPPPPKDLPEELKWSKAQLKALGAQGILVGGKPAI